MLILATKLPNVLILPLDLVIGNLYDYITNLFLKFFDNSISV